MSIEDLLEPVVVAPANQVAVEVEVAVEVAEGVPIEVVARFNDLDRRIRSVEAAVHKRTGHRQEVGELLHRCEECLGPLRLMASEQHVDLIDDDGVELWMQLLQRLPIVAEAVAAHEEDL